MTARRVLIYAWPAAVLLAWLATLHALTGHAVPRLNRDALGANFILDTMIHQLVEGGRILLVVLAVVALRVRRLDDARDDAVWATAAGVLALPLMFPAPLPRYMMPGLPLLCALAAFGLWRLAARPRALVGIAVVVAQVAGWFGASWHANGGHHLDCNLRYRTLLRTQEAAVRAIAAERPRAVAAAFPLWFMLRDAGIARRARRRRHADRRALYCRLLRRRRSVGAHRRRRPARAARAVAQLRRARAQRARVADRWRAHSYAASAPDVDRLSERSAGSRIGIESA